jgi:hypothetical protein
LYPTLAELIKTRRLLKSIVDEMGKVKGLLPQSITSINLEKMEIEFSYSEYPNENLEQVKQLIEWTLPQIEALIREGATIYEFVEEKMKLATVGIIPAYKNEGYLFVPDVFARELALYRYELSLFTHYDDTYRGLKTRLIERFEEKVLKRELQSIKLDLIKSHTDLPNPATYSVQLDLDFPFDETILPIVKRLLVRFLATH